MPDAPPPATPTTPKPPMVSGTTVPLLVAALVGVAGGIGGSWYLARQMEQKVEQAIEKALAEPTTQPDAGVAPVAAPNGGAAAAVPATKAPARKATARKDATRRSGRKDDGEDSQRSAQEAGLFQLGNEPIVANPLGTDGSRFVVCRVTIESVNSSNIGPAVEANMDRLKDAVTGYLSDTSIETIQSRGFKGQLASQLGIAFNRILGPGTVRSVIIPQLVVQ